MAKVFAQESHLRDGQIFGNLEARIHEEEWRRDFENDSTTGIIAKLRDKLRDIKLNEFPDSLEVKVSNLCYTSPPLSWQITSVFELLTRPITQIQSLFSKSNNRKEILSNISFTLAPKTMTLVIGSPGSGKSSLCKILANHEIQGKLSGEILFEGKPIRKVDHHHRVAYVRDNDTHSPYLTVQQTMEFANTLLCPYQSKEARQEKIRVILEILGLSHRTDTIVGDDLTRGVSGGERRRVSIGVELVKRCQLMVLDEATTGLDSSTALQIFRALRIIADEAIPVIATLKQPGQELVELFDQIIVLDEGKMVYCGPPQSMIPHFASLGFIVNGNINPADEMLALIEENPDKIHQFAHSITPSPEILANSLTSSTASMNEIWQAERSGEQMHYPAYARSTFVQLAMVIKRGLQEMRNFSATAIARVILALVVSLIIGTMFLQIDNYQDDVQLYSGIIFLIATFAGFMSFSALPGVYQSRPLFYYQKKNHYYRPVIAAFGQLIVQFPIAMVESLVFSTICYWLVGLNSQFDRFIYLLLGVFVLQITFIFLVIICGYTLPSFQHGNIVMPGIVLSLSFFTGFLTKYERTPDYLSWMFWVSPLRYLMEGLAINQHAGSVFRCSEDQFVPPKDDPRFILPYVLGGFERNQACPITTGEEVLDMLGYATEEAYKWWWFLVLVGFMVLMFLIAIVASKFEFSSRIPRDYKKASRLKRERLDKVISLRDSIVRSGSSIEDSFTESGESNIDIPRAGSQRLDSPEPVYLEFRNISYRIRVPDKQSKNPFKKCDQYILNNVCGYVRPGMLMAFMGPSGAGKTTLLDVLANRKTAGIMEGEILLNGIPLNPKTLARISGYVEQQNLHIQSETVKETLDLSAALRLGYSLNGNVQRKISKLDRRRHVNWVMEILGLYEIRDLMLSELSMEQKKRVNIGVELAANPSIIFLDEPTSGLDAMAALRIMKVIHTLLDQGVAAICTLHQPSQQIFQMASHLMLLSKGGYLSYFGSIQNGCDHVISYFEQLGYHYEPGRNPSDFLLDCCSNLNIEITKEPVHEAFTRSSEYQNLTRELDQHICRPAEPEVKYQFFRNLWERLTRTKSVPIEMNEVHNSDLPVVKIPVFAGTCATGWFTQFRYLLTRSIRYWWRNPVAVLMIIGLALLFGLLLGLIASETDYSQTGAQEMVVVLFFICMLSDLGAMSFIPQIFEERAVFYREVSAATYRPVSYLLGLMFSAAPIIMAASLATTIPVFALTELRHEFFHAIYYFGITLGTAFLPYGMVLFFSAISATADAANGMITVINMVGFFTCGFLLVPSKIPGYWIWAYWTAYLHYGLEGLLINQFKGLSFECADNEEAVPVVIPSRILGEEDRIQYYCEIRTGSDILEKFDINQTWLIPDICILVGGFFGLILLSAIALTKLKHLNR